MNATEKVACVGIEGINIYRPSYKCELHRFCVDNFKPQNEILKKWENRYESKIFTLCRLCGDFSQ